MTPEVEAAVQEIRDGFPGHRVEVEPEPQGGAYVVVHDVHIGDQYAPSTSWTGFLITYQCPYTDCYPHYINEGVKRVDGQALGSGFSGPTSWQIPSGVRSAVQVSRKANRHNAATDTPLLKLRKVLKWMGER